MRCADLNTVLVATQTVTALLVVLSECLAFCGKPYKGVLHFLQYCWNPPQKRKNDDEPGSLPLKP